METPSKATDNETSKKLTKETESKPINIIFLQQSENSAKVESDEVSL